MWSGHTGCVRTRNRTEKVTDQKTQKLRVVGTRKIADLPRDDHSSENVQTGPEPVDPTASYKPSEYALHLAYPDLQETIDAFKRSGRNALVIARSTLAWSSTASTFCGKFLDNPEYTFTQGRFRRDSVTIATVLHHLAINDTVLILDAEENVNSVYERLACAVVDANRINASIMTTVLRRRFGGNVRWPEFLDALTLEPSHIDAAFAQSETAGEAIYLLGELAEHAAVEKLKAKKTGDDKSAVAAIVEKAKAGEDELAASRSFARCRLSSTNWPATARRRPGAVI